MSILIGAGVVGTITLFYLGRKGWYALHKAVGITPGVLTYQDPNAPLSLSTLQWQQLKIEAQYLKVMSDSTLMQLQRIDKKVATYQNYQQYLQQQNRTLAVDESQVILQKLIYTRLPEVLASYYHLLSEPANISATKLATQAEAEQLLQATLDTIEKRLDTMLEQVDNQHLQDLQVMKRYLDSRD